jgi:hypothetical protein
MNSSDRSGLEEEEEGWTQVLSKSNRKKLLKQKKSTNGARKHHMADKYASASEGRSRANSSSRSRSPARGADAVSEDEVPVIPAGEEKEQAVDSQGDAPVKEKEKRKRSRSSSNAPKDAVVPETPLGEQVSSGKKSGKPRVIQVNAADGKTLEDLIQGYAADGKTLDDQLEEIFRNSVTVEPRDIDPSSQLPTPSVIRQVAEMLIEDGSTAPPLELGMPSTKRREAALQRLRRTLGCSYMQAERLLTCSALSHDHGKENYAHALALGKFFKRGAQVEDGAEQQRIVLRRQLQKQGYNVEQVDLALKDLEATLGILNITASEVQGWLACQALAYEENRQRNMSRDQPLRGRQADAKSHTCHDPCCVQCEKKPKRFPKVDRLLRAYGMDDAAAAIHQAANTQPSASERSGTTANDPGRQALFNTVRDLQNDVANEGPSWNMPPAVKSYLTIRDAIMRAMQSCSTLQPYQLLRKVNAHVAAQPTVLEAVHSFPSVCQVKYELAGLLHQELEQIQCSIKDLELGSRMVKADILERSTDQVMQQLAGPCNRKLVEAEFERANKRLGDSNEATQQVLQLMKDLEVPTPSWRKKAGKESDTPRSLGASYRIGESSTTGVATKRREAGLDTARLAAQQEVQAGHSTPAKESRYRNADAIATLRKMLKEDPELSSLPAEQQLRLAARRVNRRIDFQDTPAKESEAVKRSAGEAADDSDEDDTANSEKKPAKTLKARRSLKGGAGKDGGDGGDPNSDSGSGTSASSDDDSKQSGDLGSGSSSQSGGSGAEDSDSMGSPCGSEDDSRDAGEDYDTSDGFCISDDDAESGDSAAHKSKKHKPKKDMKKLSKPVPSATVFSTESQY